MTNNIGRCEYCNRYNFKSLNGRRNHETWCSNNPNRKNHPTHGKTPWNKGLTVSNSPELADKISAGGKTLGKKIKNGEITCFISTPEFWTKERREEKSKWRKELHKNNPEAHPNRKLAGNRNKMTYPEKVAFDYLDKLNVDFEHQFNIDCFYCDFRVADLIIEVDGYYWHDIDKDKKRDKTIESDGYRVYRIDTRENIEKRIFEILKQNNIV